MTHADQPAKPQPSASLPAPRSGSHGDTPGRTPYKWIALTNTTLGVFMASADTSIVLIAMPAIFKAISIDPLVSGTTTKVPVRASGHRHLDKRAAEQRRLQPGRSKETRHLSPTHSAKIVDKCIGSM
jgi:hypothetical protein